MEVTCVACHRKQPLTEMVPEVMTCLITTLGVHGKVCKTCYPKYEEVEELSKFYLSNKQTIKQFESTRKNVKQDS